jgi:hypothetical protein
MEESLVAKIAGYWDLQLALNNVGKLKGKDIIALFLTVLKFTNKSVISLQVLATECIVDIFHLKKTFYLF